MNKPEKIEIDKTPEIGYDELENMVRKLRNDMHVAEELAHFKEILQNMSGYEKYRYYYLLDTEAKKPSSYTREDFFGQNSVAKKIQELYDEYIDTAGDDK